MPFSYENISTTFSYESGIEEKGPTRYVFLQRKYTFYHQSTLLDAFRKNSRNIIGRNPSMVIPSLANQDLTLMHAGCGMRDLSQHFIFFTFHTMAQNYAFVTSFIAHYSTEIERWPFPCKKMGVGIGWCSS